jgi:hypothetical protein
MGLDTGGVERFVVTEGLKVVRVVFKVCLN